MSPAPEKLVTVEELKTFRNHLQVAITEMQAAADMHILNVEYARFLRENVSDTRAMLHAIVDLIKEEEKGEPVQ